MTQNLQPALPFNAHVLESLACPVCFAGLKAASASEIECSGCGRLYPLIDGIPVLIPERAAGTR